MTDLHPSLARRHLHGWTGATTLLGHPEYQIPAPQPVNLLDRPYAPPVLNQGPDNDCNENAVAWAMMFLMGKQGLSQWMPSRLALWYAVRNALGEAGQNVGSSIAQTIAAAKRGIPSELVWPYSEPFTQSPTLHTTPIIKIIKASVIKPANMLKGIERALAEGFPVVVGATIYDTFVPDPVTGIIPNPKLTDTAIGGHCWDIVGDDGAVPQKRMLNSWGEDWGQKGCAWLPDLYPIDEAHVIHEVAVVSP